MRDDSFKLHEPHKSNWALWIIFIVLIAFGIFWYIEDQKESTAPTTPAQHTTISSPIDSLQASVIQSEIPDFSKEF